MGPLSDDGSLDPAKAPAAAWFVRQVHALIPGVRVQAWLGDEVAPSGGMDVESAATRARIVGAARQVPVLGFDGVHLDLEPIGDADPGYLLLLSALRPVVHAAGRVLSVSAEQVEPLPGTRWPMEAVEGHSSWWSAGYLRQVAARVDQVAIRSYDTALWSPSAYSGFVRDETATALAVVPPDVALLIGVPAYHDVHSLEHSSSAETTGAACGVRLGIGGPTPKGRHPRRLGRLSRRLEQLSARRRTPNPGGDQSPMSSYQSSGRSAMNSRISPTHSGSSSTVMPTPCSASQSWPPWNVVASPITTCPMPNWRTRPEQYQQGESVVTMIVSR